MLEEIVAMEMVGRMVVMEDLMVQQIVEDLMVEDLMMGQIVVGEIVDYMNMVRRVVVVTEVLYMVDGTVDSMIHRSGNYIVGGPSVDGKLSSHCWSCCQLCHLTMRYPCLIMLCKRLL